MTDPDYPWIYTKRDDRKGKRLRVVNPNDSRAAMVLVRFEGEDADVVVSRNHFKRAAK